MSGKIMIGLFVVGLLFLSGCTSETPRGDIAAPTPEKDATATASPSPEVKDSYALGEKFTATNGLEVTLVSLTHYANCGSDGACTAAFVKLKNNGDEKVNDWSSGSVILGDDGTQYEKEYVDCPNEYDFSSGLFPGAKREGNICFSDVKNNEKVKVILDIGLFNNTKLVYVVNANQIETAKKSIEFSITSVDADWTPSEFGSGYGSVSGVKCDLKNTGETKLEDVTYDYTLMKTTATIDSGKDKTMFTFAKPGESEENCSLSIYKSLPAAGKYVLNVTVKDKDGVLAQTAYPFEVN